MTTITVVIPVKNDAPMLDHCLRALAAQVRPPDEVIVVDNGSSDDSVDVAVRYGATVLHQPAPGIWATAATGFDAASGEILARLDADSRPPEDWLQRIERAFDARPDAVAISGPGEFYDMAPVGRAIADVFYVRAYFVFMWGALGHRPLFGSNLALRASAWARMSGTVHRDDPDVHDDMDIGYHLDPADEVIHDRALVVGVSGRPFSDAASMLLRTRRAVHTVAVHDRRDQPFGRWSRRVRTRRARAVRGERPAPGRASSGHEVP